MHDTERVTRGYLPHWYKPGYAHFVTYRLADSIPQNLLINWKHERQRRMTPPFPDGVTPAEQRERAHKLFFKQYDQFLDRDSQTRWLENEDVAQVVRDNLYHHDDKLFALLAWCVMPNHVHLLIQPFESALTGPGSAFADAGSVSHESIGSAFGGDARHQTDANDLRDTERPIKVVADAASIGNIPTSTPTSAPTSTPTYLPVFYNNDVTSLPLESDEAADRTSFLSRIMHSLKSYTANRANELLRRSGGFWQRESYDHWVRDLDELHSVIEYIRWNPVTAGLCTRPQDWRFSSAFDRFQRDGSESGLVGWLRDDWRR